MRTSAFALLCATTLSLTSIDVSHAQEGALDFLDYCKSIEADFRSHSDAISSNLEATRARFKGWYDNPETMPESALSHYRDVIQLAALKEWRKSASGQELIAAWKAIDPDANIEMLYFEKIYSKEVGYQTETKLARILFKFDYEDHLKDDLDKKINDIIQKVNEQKSAIDAECSSDVLSQIFRATIGRALLTFKRNEEAAKREDGDIAKVVRYTTGISLTDIMKYGLRGGEGSELRKLQKTWTDGLDNIGIGENHFLREAGRALDPTTLNIPKELQITIDDRSLSNLEKNINPFRWEW